MSVVFIYNQLEEILNKKQFKFNFNKTKGEEYILITFSTTNEPVSIFINVGMNGRTIQFYSKIRDKKVKEKYFRYLLEENNQFKFLKWSIYKDDMVCTVDLFIQNDELDERNILSILDLIISSHIRINEKIIEWGVVWIISFGMFCSLF